MKKAENFQVFDLQKFIDFNGISIQQASKITKLHRTTLTRIIRDNKPLNAAASELLRLHIEREPPDIDGIWKGWEFADHGLKNWLSPRIYRPIDILMIPALETQARELHQIKQNYTLQSKLF